jgi:uncharacterized protein YjdB
MTAVKDFVPDNLNDDPNYPYQLTSHLDQSGLKDQRAKAVKNIATAGSSVPQASTLRAGNTVTRATPATELTTRVGTDFQVKRVDVNFPSTSVAVNGTRQLTPTITPTWATTKTVSYVSSAPGVATVSAAGLVTGVAVGTANVTITSTDQAKTVVSVVKVTAV